MKVLGLFVEGETINFSIIERKQKKILLHEVGSCSLKDSKFISKNYHVGKIGTSLPTSLLLIKQAQFPHTKKSLLEKAISLQAETLSPMNPEEYFYLTKKQIYKEKIDITYLFTKKSHIQQTLLTWNHLGFDPDVLTVVPQALIRFCKSLFSELKDGLILHVGKEETTLVHMKNHLLENALSMDFSSIDIKEDNQESGSHPINDILSAISSFHLEKPLPLMITGFQNSFFSHALEQALLGKVAYIIPGKGKLGQWGRFAIAIGSALDTVSRDDHKVQCRIHGFHSSKSLKSFGRTVMLFYLAAAGSSFIFYREFAKWKDRKIERITSQCKTAIHRDNLVTQRKKKIDLDQPLDELLTNWEEKLGQENTPFRFPLSVPKVGEFIVWIEQNLFTKNEVKLLSMDYQLKQFPTLQKPRQPYVGKVKIDCQIDNGDQAKRIIEILDQKTTKGTPYAKVEWSNEGSKYNLNFTLQGNYEPLRKDW